MYFENQPVEIFQGFSLFPHLSSHTLSLSIYLNFPFLLSFLISSMDVFFYLSKPSLFTPKAYFIAFQGERKKKWKWYFLSSCTPLGYNRDNSQNSLTILRNSLTILRNGLTILLNQFSCFLKQLDLRSALIHCFQYI